MLWPGIALTIGLIMCIADYRMATAPDPKDKHKRRKKLNPVAAKQLRGMMWWTLVATVVAYFMPGWFAD